MDSPTPDWSGSGSSSRELFNEIQFIPNHHLPKYFPLGPKSEDVNVIMEEDFSSSNNKKGNVFVDDFYYDYNFINFHEDLSYDTVDEKDNERGDLKPDVGIKTIDREGTWPDFLPTLTPEGGSPTLPAPGHNNEEEHNRVQDRDTVVTVHNTRVFSSTAFSVAPKSESTQAALPENGLSTVAMRRHFPFISNVPKPLDDPQENPFKHVVLEEDTAATLPSTSIPYSVSLTSLPAFSKSSRDRENAASTPEDTPDPRQSSKIRDPGDRPHRGLLHFGEPSSPGEATVAGDRNTSPVWFSTVTTAAAGMDGPSHLFPHRRFPPSEATTGLSSAQGPRENSKDLDYITNVHSSENDRSTEGAQIYRHDPVGAPDPGGRSPATVYEETAAGPSTPGPFGLQLPTEPRVSEQAVTPRDPLPPVLPTPRQAESNETKTDSDTEYVASHRDHGLFPNSSLSPSGARGEVTGSRGGPGPSLTTVKQPGGDEEPPSVPPATITSLFSASWEAGNWSECSTTCGLGAIWRTVRCSTGKNEDCAPTGKPVPARRCYLRPCSSWHVGNWSKCSRTCGRGVKVRDVGCIDTRDLRPLRPFHCQAVLYKPPAQMPCQITACLDWYTSSWRECSELCGGGEQERLVTCPEPGRCDETLRPNHTRPCNTHPCTKWTVGSWGQCTATCGGGVQRRQVKCVDVKTREAEEDAGRCDQEQRPEKTQKCSLQPCPPRESGGVGVCERDRLSFSFCQTLLLLGRCHLPTISTQCCQTCHQHGHRPRDRGNERASRRR